MKKILILLIIPIIFFSCSNIDSNNYDLIIQNVKLFDGETIKSNTTLFIKDDTITDILVNQSSAYQGKNVIDGKGKTLIPGLLNAHVHAWEPIHLEEASSSGVFTLLDLFSDNLSIMDSLKQLGNIPGYPYFFSAGFTVTVPKGHGTQYGTPVPTVTTLEEIPDFISQRVDDGSDFIKLIIEDGSQARPKPTLSPEMIRSAIAESKKWDKISVAHISRRSDAILAAESGINGLAHIWRKDTIGITDEEVNILKDKDVFIIPTLILRQKIIEN